MAGLEAARSPPSFPAPTPSAPAVRLGRTEAARGEGQAVRPRDERAMRFRSSVVPPCRKSPKLAEVLPLMYLHGISSGDFVPALEEFFGSAAGFSASVVTRLTRQWQDEHGPWCGGTSLRSPPCAPHPGHRGRRLPSSGLGQGVQLIEVGPSSAGEGSTVRISWPSSAPAPPSRKSAYRATEPAGSGSRLVIKREIRPQGLTIPQVGVRQGRSPQ